MAEAHPYGLAPNEFAQLETIEQQKLVKKIVAHVKSAVPAETACWCEGVNPDEFKALMQSDQHLWNYFMTNRALGEKALMQTLRDGGAGMSEARAALEILERTFKGWERKASVNLSKQLEDALEGILKRFEDPDKTFSGPEAYDIILKELERGS